MLQRVTPSHLGAPSPKSNESTKIASRVTKAHKEQEREEMEFLNTLLNPIKLTQRLERIGAQVSEREVEEGRALSNFVSG